jgi:predicted PurR-regulated permease PerM
MSEHPDRAGTPTAFGSGSLARLAGGVLLAAGTLLVLRPFLVAIAWAAIIGYMTWPIYRRTRGRWGRPRLTAAVFTAVVALGIGVPFTALVAVLAEQASELTRAAQHWVEVGAPLPVWANALPVLGPSVADIREYLLLGSDEIPAELAGFGKQLSARLVSLAGSVAGNLFTFLVTLMVLFALYLRGESMMGHTRRLASHVLGEQAHEFLRLVGSVVQSVVFGLVGTAIVQGLVAGVGLTLFGVPSAAVLGSITVLLSFVPVGPPIVWGGASIWLLAEGHIGAGIGMAAWGFFLISSLDNVLRPILISSASDVEIPFLLVFFGVIGGLAAFGLLGLFLGPVLLAVTFALLAEPPGAARVRDATPAPARAAREPPSG